MDIAERAQKLAAQIRQHKANITTEEATKNAFVMPFISTVLGYDVFNPTEVIPEFTADYGTKKGEKIDYAIAHNGQVQLLVEVKKVGDPLRIEHASQLFRYFSVTNARIAVLTNGEVYEFYTDLDTPNRMDAKPYLVLDFSDIDETLLPQLAKLTNESFDLDSVLSAAGELKYIGQIKRILAAQFKQPDDDWIRFFASRVYDGVLTQRVREQFQPLVDKAARQFLNDQVKDRLKSALGGSEYDDNSSTDVTGPADRAVLLPDGVESGAEAGSVDGDVVTTEEEIEAYRIVRAIVCSEVAAARVVARDNKTYFGVLLDDNNRKPIARLWLNRSKKYLGLFDENKVETRIAIADVEGIYQHADQLRKTVSRYLNSSAISDAPVVEALQN
jgi:hypothetical protein